MKYRVIILLLIVFSRLTTYSQDTLMHITSGCILGYKTEVNCPDGVNFEYLNDTLTIFGRIGANCCGTHLAIIKQQLNSITITTVDTGNLCTCGCLYCFEIRIPVTTTDTIVKLNGYTYNIKNILNSTTDPELDNNNIKLFPNPAGDNLSFKINGNLKVRNVTITDISGKLIRKYNHFQNQIDLKGMAKGVYIIYFETDNKKQIAKKIIKE